MTDSYPAIAEHGLIGDQQTCALVTTDGTIDWFCPARFDSPSVFASLLDATRGGHFSIRPANTEYVTKQLYFPDTAVLITRFLSAEGVAEISDFMPMNAQWQPTDRHSIVRLVRVPARRGQPRVRSRAALRLRARRAHRQLDRARRRVRQRQVRTHAALVRRVRATGPERRRGHDVACRRGRRLHPRIASRGPAPSGRPRSTSTRCSKTPCALGAAGCPRRRIRGAGGTWCTAPRSR